MFDARIPEPHVGPLFDDLGPGRAQDEQCRIGRPVHDGFDKVEECGLGPVDVLDDHHERATSCDGLDHASHSPAHVVTHCRVFGGADDRLQDRYQAFGSRDVTDKLGQAGHGLRPGRLIPRFRRPRARSRRSASR